MAQYNRSKIVVAMIFMCAILTGCNQSLNAISPSAPPHALPSAPAEAVSSNQLPPIDTSQERMASQQVENAPKSPENMQPTGVENTVVEASATSSTHKITREGLAGSWQVPTDGSECRIILAFTKWSGGYRAATRRCISSEIQAVNAWDVKDQSVVLVDKSGNEVARLFGVSPSRYNGRTKNGLPVSFTR